MTLTCLHFTSIQGVKAGESGPVPGLLSPEEDSWYAQSLRV